jgi:hypothetical protein
MGIFEGRRDWLSIKLEKIISIGVDEVNKDNLMFGHEFGQSPFCRGLRGFARVNKSKNRRNPQQSVAEITCCQDAGSRCRAANYFSCL